MQIQGGNLITRLVILNSIITLGFPGSSSGKESICNVGDPGSIPGWEDPLEKG